MTVLRTVTPGGELSTPKVVVERERDRIRSFHKLMDEELEAMRQQDEENHEEPWFSGVGVMGPDDGGGAA